MISCEEAVRRLWEYLDHELDSGNRQRVDDHLALCRRCCGEAEFTAELQALLRTTAAPALPEDVEGHFVALLARLERDQLEGDVP